jgi:hypothetical protein
MKRILLLGTTFFLINSCGSFFKPKCYQLEGMKDKTCVRMVELIGSRIWWLDSVNLNGIDITAECLAKAKDFRFNISPTPVAMLGNSTTNVFPSTMTFNDTVFGTTYVKLKELDPSTEPLFSHVISDPQIVSLKNRPLIAGILPGGGMGLINNDKTSNIKVYSITNDKLVLKAVTKDSVLFNVFKLK